MKLKDLKKWPKIWKIAEKAAKEFLEERYRESISLTEAFCWSETDYCSLFLNLDAGYIDNAKRENPEMFSFNKIYEVW